MLTELEKTATNVFHVRKSIFYKITFIVLPDACISNGYQHVVDTARKCSLTSDSFDYSRIHYQLFCAPVEYCEALHRDISHLLGGHHINMHIHIDDCSREAWGCCGYQVILWEELFEHSSLVEAWVNDDFLQNWSMWPDPDLLQLHYFRAEDWLCDDPRTSSHNMCGEPQSLHEIGANHLKMFPAEICPETFSPSLRISIRQPKYSWGTLMPDT